MSRARPGAGPRGPKPIARERITDPALLWRIREAFTGGASDAEALALFEEAKAKGIDPALVWIILEQSSRRQDSGLPGKPAGAVAGAVRRGEELAPFSGSAEVARRQIHEARVRRNLLAAVDAAVKAGLATKQGDRTAATVNQHTEASAITDLRSILLYRVWMDDQAARATLSKARPQDVFARGNVADATLLKASNGSLPWRLRRSLLSLAAARHPVHAVEDRAPRHWRFEWPALAAALAAEIEAGLVVWKLPAPARRKSSPTPT